MSLVETLKKEENYFWEGIAASVALHLLLFNAGGLGMHLPGTEKHTVEIDITHMGHVGVAPVPHPAAPRPAAPPPKPAAPPKQWTQTTQKVAPAAAPTKAVPQQPPPPPPPAPSGPSTGEIGIGLGDGGETQLAQLPQLLNLNDLAAIQQRFYPEKAREEGREAVVVMDIHIGPDGRVNNVDIVQSADPDFNEAAVHVARLLRFSPAYVGNTPVAVKMRQAIQFKLER